MNKCHSNLNWLNDTIPAINDTNLNYMDGCIDTIDSRVVDMDLIKLEATNVSTVIKNVSLDDATGIFTFTRYDDSTFTIDSMLEKVVTNFDFNEETQKLIITLEDGSTKEVDLSSFIKETEVEDTDTIALSLVNHKLAATVKGNSIGDAQMQTRYLADCQSAKADSEAAATNAIESKLEAEGWAVGTQLGVPVASGKYFQNNAKYYSDKAGNKSLVSLDDVVISNVQNGQGLVYDEASQKWVNGDTAIKIATLPPSDISAIAGDGEVLLSWTKPEDVVLGGSVVARFDHILVRRAIGMSERVTVYEGNDDSYVDTDVVNGTTYSYFISSVTDKGITATNRQILVATPEATVSGIKAWCQKVGLNYENLEDIPEKDMALLMTKHVAVDYLADWLSQDADALTEFTTNELAMKWIGLKDYAADTLMANADIKSALLGSTYWEYILKDKVPTMTSNTTPKGVASADVIYSSSYDSWNAFDRNESTAWYTYTSTANHWIGYKFESPVSVRAIQIKPILGRVKDFTVSASNDGNTWVDIYSDTCPNTSDYTMFRFDNNTHYLYYRFYCKNGHYDASSNAYAISELQFYGRSLNVSVPKMTSNTQPSGEVKYSSAANNDVVGWKAFDRNYTTTAWVANTSTNEYLSYDFTKNICVKAISYKPSVSSGNYRVKDYSILAVTDGNEIEVYSATSANVDGERIVTFENSQSSNTWKFLGKSSYDARIGLWELNFFGVDYSEDLTAYVTLTLEGAKEDTISVKDSSGTSIGTCIFGSGATSGTVTIPIVDGEEYTFESTVAKAIDNSGANYSKTITLTKDMDGSLVKIMEDGALYWVGTNDKWNTNSTAFYPQLGDIGKAPTLTHNTNDVYAELQSSYSDSPVSGRIYFNEPISVNENDEICFYIDNVSIPQQASTLMTICLAETPSSGSGNVTSRTEISNAFSGVKTKVIERSGVYYPTIFLRGQSGTKVTIRVKALWIVRHS